MCGMTNTTGSGEGEMNIQDTVAIAIKLGETNIALSAALRREEVLREALRKLGDVEQYGTGRAFGLYCDVMVFAQAAIATAKEIK